MLVLSRKIGEAVVIDGEIRVTVLEVRANRVKLGIVGPKAVPVHREEVYREIAGRGIVSEQPSCSLAEMAPSTP